MDGSNRRMGNIKRQSAVGMGLCIAGLGLGGWQIASYVLGTMHEPAILYFALPILVGFGLIVSGFALMVSGADPFEDDTDGVRESDERKE